MKNRKGFTLIEIIGAIVILGIIAIIAFATYTSNLREFRSNYYNKLERTIAKSGEEFFEDNRNYRPSGILLAQEVTLSTLSTKNYISDVIDYNGESCNKNSYVMVIKEGRDKYTYHTCLICDQDGYDNTQENKYCDRTWLDPTKVKYGLGDLDIVYVYKGTTRDELKKILELPIAYERENNQGEVIASVRGTGEGEPTINPNNIDVVNTNVEGDYIVEYEYKGQKKPRTVKVYENAAPNIEYKKQQTRITGLDGTTNTTTENYTGGEWAQNVIVNLKAKTYVNTDIRTSRFQWNKDGRWQDFCETDPCEVKITEEMNETVQFRIIDTNGNISKITEAITFRIDNTKPKCTLTIPTQIGEHNWYKTDVVVNFAEKIDQRRTSDAYVSGIKNYNIQKSTEGIEKNKTIATVTQNQDTSGVTYIGFVIDNADNFNICTTGEFRRDATFPTCTDSGNSTTWTNGNRTIKWGCNDPKSNNSNSGCNPSYSGSEKTYSTTTKTAPIASYIIKDMAGNKTTCAARTADVYVDKIAPSCTNSGDSTTYAKSRTIYYGCSDSDSGCNPSYSGGSKVFNTTIVTSTIGAYIIKDVAGNTTPCDSRIADVYVDTTAPGCTNRGDSTTWTNQDRTIYWGCSDGNVGCETTEQSKTFNTTTKTSTISSYTIKDKLGNERTCPARTADVYVDKTSPSCTDDGDSTTWTNGNRTIYYGCSDGDSGCDESYSGGNKLFNTTTKTSAIAAYEIRDIAGNKVTCPARTADVYVDKIAPSCTNNGDSTSYATSRTIYYGCSDNDSGCNASYSGGSQLFNTTTVTSTIGAYIIKDVAGNTTPCDSRIADIYVDTTAPSCTNRGDNSSWTSGNITIYYGCSDENSGCETTEQSKTFSTTTKTSTIGLYTIKDNVGNTTTCPARTADVYVDKTAPSCTDDGDSTTWTNGNRTIYYGCSDGDSGCNASYSGGSQTFSTTTKTSTIGSYEIRDKVGNKVTCPARTADVYVDTTAPDCTNKGDNSSWTNGNITIYYGCSDDDSGCNGSYSGGSQTFSTTTTTSTIESYEIRDVAGNSVTCPSRVASVYVVGDVEKGKYLNADGVNPCPTGYYCPGDETINGNNVGLHPCPSGFPYSSAGATAKTSCYTGASRYKVETSKKCSSYTQYTESSWVCNASWGEASTSTKNTSCDDNTFTCNTDNTGIDYVSCTKNGGYHYYKWDNCTTRTSNVGSNQCGTNCNNGTQGSSCTKEASERNGCIIVSCTCNTEKCTIKECGCKSHWQDYYDKTTKKCSASWGTENTKTVKSCTENKFTCDTDHNGKTYVSCAEAGAGYDWDSASVNSTATSCTENNISCDANHVDQYNVTCSDGNYYCSSGSLAGSLCFSPE